MLMLGFALLLTLIGNSTVVGFCLSEGKFSFAGMNACEPAGAPCTCSAHAEENHAPCGNCEEHETLAVELDDEIRTAEAKTPAPVIEEFSLYAFFDFLSFYDFHYGNVAPPRSPVPILQNCLHSPKIAGTLPLLA